MRIKWFSLVRIVGLFMVLFYHFFQKQFPGGFVGVDIFYTFSGFLITSLLIDEFTRAKTIDILGFLRRRFYRIFPPLVFMILVSMPFTFLVRRDYVAGISGQITAALGFVTNYFEILTGGNYESQFIPHLFVHTWSLALEMHYYVLWGLLVWYLAQKVKTAGQLRGQIFVLSTGIALLSFLSMFIGAFFTKNYSNLYFSSWHHIYPFFIGSSLATLSGVTNLGTLAKSLAKEWDRKRLMQIMGGSFAGLMILGFFLKFDSIWTYLFGFVLSSVFAALMIFCARLLHEETDGIEEPKVVRFLADTSYGFYLFHWPFYIIFSQIMNHVLAVILTTFFSLVFAALSFYIIEPLLIGKTPHFFGVDLDLAGFKKVGSYGLGILTLVTLGIMLTAPKVGAFEQSLVVEGLKQADQKMQLTRQKADQSAASSYNVAEGVSLIGDSVALRASDYLQKEIKDIQMDASVSRNLDTGLKVYKTSIENSSLQQNIVIALGTNAINDYQNKLDQIVADLPKGHRLILITPYDGRVAGDENDATVKTRQYELELAKKYEYVYIADWYQAAQSDPSIWAATDSVHFGSDAASIEAGGTLYAQTLKATLDEANKGPIKP